ncbi:microtubule-associated tumor suppressor 1 homolog A-like [Centroberyx affinis]|uniref:microtubule-associated tumor suppressor 1 homolog A-like n=1 Tax=Centroberyx affinis TaxID=166261 RepID=UPI003A5C4873
MELEQREASTDSQSAGGIGAGRATPGARRVQTSRQGITHKPQLLIPGKRHQREQWGDEQRSSVSRSSGSGGRQARGAAQPEHPPRGQPEHSEAPHPQQRSYQRHQRSQRQRCRFRSKGPGNEKQSSVPAGQGDRYRSQGPGGHRARRRGQDGGRQPDGGQGGQPGPGQAAVPLSLQRSGSARLNRPTATSVDKNKPRGAPGRNANANANATTALVPASTGGNNQNQQQPPPDLVPDLVNANGPVTPVLPVPTADTTHTGSGTTGTFGLGFRARTGSRTSPKAGSRLQNGSKPGAVEAGSGSPTAADGTVQAKQNQRKEQAEKKNQGINHLRRLLVQGNKRVEALATVIQHLFSEREEALKQKKQLSLELANLRDELVSSSQCCDRLQKEKEEVRVSLEEALKSLEEQHREELVQLENRLRSFYQTEWDKVHQTYQEEADKCRTLMEQQVEELRSRQEAERKNREASHSQKMESLKQQHETSVEELKMTQQTDLQNLEKTLKETEASLSEKIAELSSEKEALNEKLRAEEERRRRILTDKNLKDSHTVYLEQELESLKVVLEIKNNQLHQKEKKLMEMDKLVESNVKLEECLTKVQQENEDYKARMDKHAALSKQLSSEQAMLQQTLQKESKVNKRLSMENEELLWKLHNGDLLASPRRLSPTSPFPSPRNSASFPAAAASPR